MLIPIILALILGDPADEAKALLSLAVAVEQQRQVPPLPPQTAPSAPTDHSTAWAESMRTGKPIIAWVGGNFCERCVKDSAAEFVHVFVDEWHGNRGPATVLLMPHEGTVYRVGTVNRWTEGDASWGHIPSARRLFGEFREQVRQGSLAPLRLLRMSGGDWGMSHNRFYANYQGGGSSSYRQKSSYRSGGRIFSRGGGG